MVTGDAGLLSHRVVLLVTAFVLLAGGAAVERLQELGAWIAAGTLEGGSIGALVCRLVLTVLFVALVVRVLARLLRTGVLVRHWLGLAAWMAVPAVQRAGADWYEVMPLEAVVAVRVGGYTLGVSVLGAALLLFFFRWVVWRPTRSSAVSPDAPPGS